MIKCIAVDDEPLALAQIAKYIRQIPNIELIGTYFTAGEAHEAIAREHVDVMFLDIEMPDMSGMDLVADMGKKAPLVVFTTAYPQYAVEGFKVDAVDYLLKPLAFDDMLRAVERVKRRLKRPDKPETPQAALAVKSNGIVRNIPYGLIKYVKGLSEYVQICIEGERSMVTTLESIKRLEEVLPADRFVRIHKSFLVNLDYVEEADRMHAVVNGTSLAVGDKYRLRFLQKLHEAKSN